MRIALVGIGLLISVLSLAQERLNLLYALDEYPGININQLIFFEGEIIVSGLYREENEVSSSVLFKREPNSEFNEKKIIGTTVSHRGLRLIGERLFLYGQDRRDDTNVQLLSFDKNLNLLKRDTFYDPVSNDLFPAGSLSNRGYSLFAYTGDFENSREQTANFYIQNPQGDYTYRSLFDDLEYVYPYDLDVDQKNNFIVSNLYRSFNVYGSFSQVVKIDTLGNILWRYDGEDKTEHGAVLPYIAPLSNGEIVQIYQIQGDQAPHHRMIWLSEEGSFLRDSTIVVPGLNEMYFSDLVPGRGDYFYGHGVYNFYEGFIDGYYGMLTKMANDGSVVWTRYYKHESLQIPRGYHNVIDIHEKEDGTIVLLFKAKEAGTLGNMWLLKVDSEGCYTPDCDDLQIITSSEEVLYTAEPRVSLYPNPTTSTFTVDLSNPDLDGRVQVLDVHGRLIIDDQAIVSGQAKVDLSGYHSGVYICRMLLDSGKSISKKIILQ